MFYYCLGVHILHGNVSIYKTSIDLLQILRLLNFLTQKAEVYLSRKKDLK